MGKSKGRNSKNSKKSIDELSSANTEAIELTMHNKKRARTKRPFLAIFSIVVFALLGGGAGFYYLNAISEKITARLDKDTRRVLRRTGVREFVSYDKITVHPLARSVTYHDIAISNDVTAKIVEIDAITISNYRNNGDITLSVQIDIDGVSSPYSKPLLNEDTGMLSLYKQNSGYKNDNTFLPLSAMNYPNFIGDISISYKYSDKEENLSLALRVSSRGISEVSAEVVFVKVDMNLLGSIAKIVDDLIKGNREEFLQLFTNLDNGDYSSLGNFEHQALQIVDDMTDIKLASFTLQSHDLGFNERLSYVMAYSLGRYDSQQVDLLNLVKTSDWLKEYREEIDDFFPGVSEVITNSVAANGRVSIKSDFSYPIPILEKHLGNYDLSSDLKSIRGLIEDGDIQFSN